MELIISGRFGAAIAPIAIGIIAEAQSIGFGLAVLGIAYALSGIIPALFIREKIYDPYENKENVSITAMEETAAAKD